MARPYINTSDKNGSLLNPTSGGSNTPISYRANVNRQKTKKWAEAKKIDYGGDDWGDDDEYDPYDAYGNELEPAPAPMSKPTGLRQPGQGLPGARGMSQDRSQKSYGNLPSASVGSPLNRRNSFEADDETRHFSNATIRQESPLPTSPPHSADSSTVAATRFSQMGVGGIKHTRDPSGPPTLHISTQQPSPTGLRKPSLSANPVPPESSLNSETISQPARTNTNDSSVLSVGSVNTPSDYGTSKDFSPSAVPAPLSMRPAPAPQSATTAAPTTKFPARKSSLSTMGTEAQRIYQKSHETLGQPFPTSSRPSPSPGSADRSATTPGASNIKPLPFIRPADIYRRVEEEKQERERASLDSVRPSMDSLRMERSSDISHSPGQGAVRGRSSSDSLGPGNRGKFSFGDEGSDSGRRLMPILEPVKERKSEYGFDGFNANEIPSPAQEITNPPPAEPKITSPILPDVHRISGFGSDFFSRSANDSAPAPPAETISELPEQTSSGNSDQPGDTSLRSQPSFGFKSVVNQAFDRKDDNSVPPTPVSNTEGNVKRSDSESTGTTGISPIMSRGPSTTDNRSREMSTPAIMEQVEPISPRLQNISNESDNQIVPPTFIPGHRRDISTPSPGNSPARTPDLGNASKRISMGEQAWISSASPTSPAKDAREDADPEPPRPTLDRDVSFRPQIPGGWQSYTTIATTSTVQPETPRSPSPQVPSDPVQALAMEDLTPTTTKHSLPESSLEAARVTLGVKSDSMPTPDPNGNVHSAMTPHPELIPSLEKASPEAQLRPDYVDQPNPPDSPSIPPIKDSLVSSEEPTSETLLEPTTDFQLNTADDFSADEPLLPPLRPQILPTLSTDTGPLDEENDRLRKDIVKSLSPRPSQSEQGHENLRERPLSDNMEESRESTYLTDVYDDYWNDMGDEDHSSPIATTSPDKLQAEQTVPADMPVIRPLSSHRMSKQQARPPLPTRFSWEKSMDTVAPTDIGMPESPTNHAELPVEKINAPIEGLQQIEPEPYMEKEVLEEVPHNDDHMERNAALGTSAVLLGGGATAVTQRTISPESPPTVSVSLAQEKEQPQFASYPIVPTPENEHPAFGSTLDLSTDPLGSNPHSASSSPSPFIAREPSPSRRESATSLRTSSMGKILTFKEIVGMKDVHERVHAFDETRERFAAMDSGIHEWIFALKAEQPEHADVNECYGGFRTTVPTGSTRRNTRSGSAALQSPYYQQYLNASAPSQTSLPASRTGQTGPSGIQQGFSPAHAKITTQQVQAKGKEFLHTAGIFGGKAGKAGFQAGKGLLAKGKNRLRAAGSSDKTSPPPKSRNPDRSSWGLALNLSRATGRTDPGRNAEQNIPFEPTGHSQISIPSGVFTPIGIVGIPPTSDEEAQAEHAEEMNLVTRDTAGEILAPDKMDGQYILNPPVPMSKYELTWDPFDTAQFSDSNHFTNDKQTNQYLMKDDCVLNNFSVLPRSARSTSDDTASNNAQKENFNRRNSAAAALVIGGYTVQAPAELDSSTRVPISMINRPRGASLDQATTSDHFSRPTIGSVQTPLSTQPINQTIAAPEEQGRQPSSKTLPPIRRTSKFGFEFGSRRPQTRFPISDDEDEFEVESNGGTQNAATPIAAEVKENLVPQQNSHADVAIADIVRDPKANLQTSPQPRFSVFPRVAEPSIQRSPTQDMGRLNPAIRHTRQDSWNSVSKSSRSRRGSASDKQLVQPRDSNAPPLIPALPFETPPSSTQRYPELFGGPVSEIRNDPDMPGGYHQAPPSRTTEPFPSYHRAVELPGARPLESSNEPTAHRRRRSSDLVNRGINLVRSLSRERRSSVSKDEKKNPINASASPPMRDDRQKRRGSGFWGTFDITGEQSSNSGRESMVAQHSSSQSNFMNSQHDSPQTPKPFLKPNSILEAPHSNMFGRSTTTMGKPFQKDEKRSRLSGLSGLFSRSPKGDGSVLFKPKRATTDLSSFGPRSGTLSSPQFEDHSIKSTNMSHKRRPSQPLNFLSKLGPSTSLQKTETPPRQDSKLHLEPRPRRPSVSGLLTGMLRKRSNTLEKDSERNEDNGRKPVVVPVARMYSDLGAESHEVLPDAIATPTQRLRKRDQDQEQTRSSSNSDGNKQEYSRPRSHHHSRWYDTPPRIPEPQYDSVPIPDGYNLVRGDGTTPTPTNYDPRGINSFSRPSPGEDLFNSSQQYLIQSPVSPLACSGSSVLHPSPPLHQTFSPERRLINLPSIDTHSSPLASSIRTDLPSHEDILARSPAREQPGQQRPFQLALPLSSDVYDQYYRSSTPPVRPPKDEYQLSRSPTSVPLPMGEFSPSYENIDIDRFPLPPSPSQQSPDWHRNRNLSVATDDGLRRSSTGRSLVSAVSQISDSPSPQPHRVSVMDDKLYVDCDDGLKRHSGNFSDPVSRLPGEDADLGDEYSERKKDEVAMRGGDGVADIDEREISEHIHHKDVVNSIAHAKEYQLQMSATSYPGMEWNPYVDG